MTRWARRTRRAFTLVELIASLAIAILLTGSVLRAVSHHQRAFRALQERILVSGQLRDGEQALLADLRGTAVSGDTLRMLSDSAVEFFSMIGSGVVCGNPSGTTVGLVPEGLSSGNSLTSLPVPPDTGDMLSVYSAPDPVGGQRRWLKYRIQSVGSASASTVCPEVFGFTSPSDLRLTAQRITVAGSETPAVTSGAPVRFLRRGRYSIYRSSDGDWYLGYKRCNAVAAGCSAIQPVSGPYLPYAQGGAGGLRFRYLDSTGSPLPATRPLDVTSFEVTLRAEVGIAGRIMGRSRDSAVFVITPRNFR